MRWAGEGGVIRCVYKMHVQCLHEVQIYQITLYVISAQSVLGEYIRGCNRCDCEKDLTVHR